MKTNYIYCKFIEDKNSTKLHLFSSTNVSESYRIVYENIISVSYSFLLYCFLL